MIAGYAIGLAKLRRTMARLSARDATSRAGERRPPSDPPSWPAVAERELQDSVERREGQATPLAARRSRPLEGGPSFSFGNRAYRALWAVAWLALASWTPPFLHGWRRLVLRLFGARVAPGARVYSSVRIWDPRHLALDAYACLGPRVDCYAMASISLGRYAVVSQDAVLCAGTHDIDDPDFQLTTKPVVIGERAWIAAGAFVGPGVSIGEGAVLGARAVAFSNLAPWTVYAGNPARRLKERARLTGYARADLDRGD